MNKQRKVVITTTYNEMGIIIDTKAEEVAQPYLQPTCNNLATDTISRQAAIEAIVNTVSGIGLHDNSEVARYGATFRQHEIIDIIEGMPSAQPEIITCTECKYYDTDTEQCNNDKGLRFIDFGNPERMWCSWVERREEL